MIRSEATDVALSRSILKRQLRNTFLRAFYGQCVRFLAIGRNARQHYLAHGIPVENIFWSPYCVDSKLFDRQAREYLPQRGELRHTLGFADTDIVFLFSAKLIPKKDPLTLVRAFQAIPESQRQMFGLIIVGDGELRSEVETACRKALGERAVFVGFINQSQIGQFYAAADCLVLPSVWGETWGLVVNEALQFGMPAIVSDRVGCHPDLIVEGETGYIFPAGDAQALKNRILQTAAWLKQSRTSIAERCRQQVAGYTVKQAADGIYDAIFSF